MTNNIQIGHICIRRELKNDKLLRICQLICIGEIEGILAFDVLDDSGKPLPVRYYIAKKNYPSKKWKDDMGDWYETRIDPT